MGKLPEIDFGGAVSREGSSAIGQDNESRRAAFKVFEQGFTVMGQEVVKSQMQRGMADVSRGLNDLEIDLDTNRTYSTKDIRDKLGAAYDSLAPAVKSQLTRKVQDPQTGQMIEQDREDIPSWLVTGPIYDEQSKRILKDASQGFNSEGWAAEFQDKMQQEIAARKLKLGEKQLKEFHQYITEADTSNAIDLANTGNFNVARVVVKNSRSMDLEHKEKVLDHIDKIEQVYPVYEALRRQDYGSMAAYLGKLNDPKEFTKLSPQERTAFSDRLKSEINQFDLAARKAAEEKVKAVAEAGWNNIFSKERAGVPVSYADIPPPGTIHAEAQKEMIGYVDKLNKGEKPETDWGVYAGLLQTARDPKELAKIDLMMYRNKLADPEFKQLLEMQLGLKGKGDPDAYDTFQTTDEAINFRLRQRNVDPSDKGDESLKKVGQLKTIIQHELASEQRAKNGQKLDVQTRDGVIDRVLNREIDPKAGFLDSTSVPTYKAGVPASMASSFRSAVQALDPKGMSTKGGRVKSLQEHLKDFNFYTPTIERAWQVQAGGNILPDDSVKVWYRLKSQWGSLEGRLRATGGWTEDASLRQKRLVQLAVQEILSER
jgi:hypothetical protein